LCKDAAAAHPGPLAGLRMSSQRQQEWLVRRCFAFE
jgi:hypothetical protein